MFCRSLGLGRREGAGMGTRYQKVNELRGARLGGALEVWPCDFGPKQFG
jgi:hypothetical protein